MGRAGGQRGHRNDSIDHSRSPKQCHPAHSSRRMCVSLCLLHSRRLSYWHTLWLSPFVCLTFFSVCIHMCAFQTDASVMALAKCQLFHTVPLALQRLAVDCYWLPMASIHWLFSEKHTHTQTHTCARWEARAQEKVWRMWKQMQTWVFEEFGFVGFFSFGLVIYSFNSESEMDETS